MKKRVHLLFMLVIIVTFVFSGNVIGADSSYTVKDGEVLWKIAREHDMDWETLAEVNKLENPHLIFSGQDLIIPSYDKKNQSLAYQ